MPDEQTTPTTPTPTTPTEPTSLTSQTPPATPEAPVDPATPEPAPEFVPLTAEKLAFPEGMTVADDDRDSFLGILNNQEMSTEDRAQALIDLQAKVAKEASEAGSQAWADMQTQWVDEVKADPDLGGAKLEGTLSDIAKVVDQYGSQELRAVMDLTGAGNNVHVVRFLNNVAKALAEGGPVSGSPGAGAQSAADLMYPSMAKGA